MSKCARNDNVFTYLGFNLCNVLGARNINVFTYFDLNLCNVLGAKNDTAVHLLTLDSIFVMS